jgi:hypothetical protein
MPGKIPDRHAHGNRAYTREGDDSCIRYFTSFRAAVVSVLVLQPTLSRRISTVGHQLLFIHYGNMLSWELFEASRQGRCSASKSGGTKLPSSLPFPPLPCCRQVKVGARVPPVGYACASRRAVRLVENENSFIRYEK